MKPRFSLFMFLFALYLPLISTAAVATPPSTVSVANPPEKISFVSTAPGERVKPAKAERRARRAVRQDPEGGTRNGMAVAGFVCSLVGIFFLGIILGPLGITFSAIGLSRANKQGLPRRGLAIAGLVLGIIATVGWFALIVAAAGSV